MKPAIGEHVKAQPGPHQILVLRVEALMSPEFLLFDRQIGNPRTGRPWIAFWAEELTSQVDAITTVTYSYFGTTYSYQYGTKYEDAHYAFSPLFRLGLAFFPDHLVSARIDAAYVGYANTITAGGQTYDLGFSGWMVRPMVQVRL